MEITYQCPRCGDSGFGFKGLMRHLQHVHRIKRDPAMWEAIAIQTQALSRNGTGQVRKVS